MAWGVTQTPTTCDPRTPWFGCQLSRELRAWPWKFGYRLVSPTAAQIGAPEYFFLESVSPADEPGPLRWERVGVPTVNGPALVSIEIDFPGGAPPIPPNAAVTAMTRTDRWEIGAVPSIVERTQDVGTPSFPSACQRTPGLLLPVPPLPPSTFPVVVHTFPVPWDALDNDVISIYAANTYFGVCL